jgi:DNA repair protein RadC
MEGKPRKVVYTVHEVPARQRPRELFARMGAENVSEDVLLSIILRSGVTGHNVIELADEILRKYGSLRALSRASVDELVDQFDGMGPVKAQTIIAALELGRRLQQESADVLPVISTPEDVATILESEAKALEKERFWILILDTRNRLKEPPFVVSEGLINASLVHPREVFNYAVKNMAASVVLAHNHPSGDPSPSPEDIKVTRELVKAGEILDIKILDHIIMGHRRVGHPDYFVSLRESGLVDFGDL